MSNILFIALEFLSYFFTGLTVKEGQKWDHRPTVRDKRYPDVDIREEPSDPPEFLRFLVLDLKVGC